MHTSLPGWLTSIIIEDRIKVSEDLFLQDTNLPEKKSRDFEAEWEEHRNHQMTKTWGFEANQRLEQLYLETNTSAEELSNLIVLDAGCGNGLLTKAISGAGARVVGVDIINNLEPVTKTEDRRDNLYFLHADIQDLPLKGNSFDLIISNGVLHHTADTKDSFLKLAQMVKPRGKLYVWLYRKPFKFKKKFFFFISDAGRKMISPMPTQLQKPVINAIASAIYFIDSFKKEGRRNYTDLLIDVYDSLTPRYRHYHNPIEVAGWFYEAGFSSPHLNHWDNSFGFGMCAEKLEYKIKPAGENYGKESRDPELHLS